MRKIKFRAWDKENKKMFIPEGISNSGWVSTSFSNDDWWNPETFELMQYTGLKDKNGKEIYEGDIVRCGTSKEAEDAEIVFKEQSFLCKYLPEAPSEDEQIYDHMEDYEYYEIIGNIYENPDMI